jgi:hypothetical protein
MSDSVDQLDPKDMYGTLDLSKIEYTFFSRTHGTFSGMLGH